MNNLVYKWPSPDMDLWKISNKDYSVLVKWSHDCFADYKKLSYRFYSCGYTTFIKVSSDMNNHVLSDKWFLTGIFLVRHSLELGIKALLCRVLPQKRDIQNAFKECCHDVSLLLEKYFDSGGTVPCQVDTYKNENTIFLIQPNRGNIPPRFGHFF
ncbi:hypothetical protein [Limosilactobacillus fermentum]|uniref:hypothetical protein n=1 Tax=Limosilactobacillus fermentum TaxID=1613 RepID=UPI0027BCCA7C|nr:hypothetical protein [Limosilactobacillus fermentum]MDQ2153672.1 hypothetical protein [Limosilactobacillus fermentum]